MERLPFRLGSTSYVYPAGLVENARRLAAEGLIRDMELVLFDLDDGPSNFPDAATIRELQAVAANHDLTYTVHLPLDLRLRENGGPEHISLVKAKRVIEATLPLDPAAVVAHLETAGYDDPAWVAQMAEAVQMVAGWLPSPDLLAIENLESYDPALVATVAEMVGVSRTLDIGHLWKQGAEPLPVLHEWLPQTRVIHLHGFSGVFQRAHQALDVTAADQLDPVLAALRDYQGVLTLEVFEEAFFSSRAALLAAWERIS